MIYILLSRAFTRFSLQGTIPANSFSDAFSESSNRRRRSASSTRATVLLLSTVVTCDNIVSHMAPAKYRRYVIRKRGRERIISPCVWLKFLHGEKKTRNYCDRIVYRLGDQWRRSRTIFSTGCSFKPFNNIIDRNVLKYILYFCYWIHAKKKSYLRH